MAEEKKIRKKLSSFQIILLGFIGVIILGALILMLPISSQTRQFTPFIKALFTATSSVCVTGLVVLDTASYWSLFGQIVILIMIQIGGLGVITIALLLSLIAGKKIGIMQRQTMQDALSAPQLGGIVKLTRFMFFTSFIVESIGIILLIPFFVPQYGARGVWMATFHSISAFCNAGFDLMGSTSGQFSSLTSYSGSGYLTVVISLLIIIGGLGFITWNDVITQKHHIKSYRMQTKVVLVTTAFLLIVPTIFFFINDFAKEPIGRRLCLSIFQTVTARTAGFNTADIDQMSDAGKTIMIILMLIGGSPASTAGGIKTTTVAVLFLNTIAVFKRKPNANCFGRRIDDGIVKNASTVLFLYLSLALSSALIISIIEGLPMQKCMFETFSAIATVGLSLGLTPGLSLVSHIILILLMFFGRVGGLTIIYAAFSNRDSSTMKYPLENITVG